MADEIPEWAMNKAEALVRDLRDPSIFWMDRHRNAFARYIAEHEEPPVDPVIREARQICADELSRRGSERAAREYLAGYYDQCNGPNMSIAVAALKRGMELAKTETSNA